MILRFASQYDFKLNKTAPLQHTLGSIMRHQKKKKIPIEDSGQTFESIISDKLEQPFDPASGKTERELQSFAYLTIFKDIISSIELLQWRKDRNMRTGTK